MFDFTKPIIRSEDFFGRATIRDSLLKRVRSTVIIGEARVGRTSLLLQLERDLDGTTGRHGPRMPIYLNLRKPTLRTPSDVYAALVRAVFLRLKEVTGPNFQVKWDLTRPEIEDVIEFFDNLKLQGVDLEVVALLDNINQPEMFRHGREEFFAGLRTILDFSPGDSLKLIASATTEFLFIESVLLSKLLSRLYVVRLSAFSADEVVSFVETEQSVKKSKSRDLIGPYVHEITGGHPCLVQELLGGALERRAGGRSFLKSLELQATELSKTGGSFFEEYIKSLSFDETCHLVSLAFSAEAKKDLPIDVAKRFMAAGLLNEAGDTNRPGDRCQLFFEWLRVNLNRVLPEIALGPVFHTLGDLSSRLREQLPSAIGRKLPSSEQRFQDIIQGMLAAYSIPYIREEEVRADGKKFRIDFGLSGLNCALEIKLITTSNKVGAVIDELLADMALYKRRYDSFLAIIATRAGHRRLMEFAESMETPYCQLIVIKVLK